ncbi:DUF4831 family protein [Bacteroidales bacterium OttesenSCG-928-M11]|nr:DUF4831 family protein [Bacteroidales bacterium OttesenSCG-928-M11]
MKNFFLSIFILSSFVLNAQTKVIKTNALKSNNYGVEYILPQTQLIIEVEYSKVTKKSGQYARYASRYLGLPDDKINFENQTIYTLDNVHVKDQGIPNKDQTYLVEFKAKTTAPFVYLTSDGMICTINAEYTPEEEKETSIATEKKESFISPQSIFTEEYLHAGSIGKMAEVAAKNIYNIRETRQDILMGEVENMPKDGEAMRIVLAGLEEQERLWVELFTGTTETKKGKKRIYLDPTMELSKDILFRFSKHNGIVDREDLSGVPVFINLIDLKTVEIPELDPKRKAKEPQSVVYNVPGKAQVEIFTADKSIYQGDHEITQFGTTQILATSIFEDKTNPVKIYFYPNTGGIKQIIN